MGTVRDGRFESVGINHRLRVYPTEGGWQVDLSGFGGHVLAQVSTEEGKLLAELLAKDPEVF